MTHAKRSACMLLCSSFCSCNHLQPAIKPVPLFVCASRKLTGFHGIVCLQDVSAYNGQLRSLVGECNLAATELLQQVASVGSALTSLALYKSGEPLDFLTGLPSAARAKEHATVAEQLLFGSLVTYT